MRFTLLNSDWDKNTHIYNYLVRVESSQLRKLVTISVQAPKCKGDKLFMHQALLLDIFETYPAAGCQESLALLNLRLKQYFRNRRTRIVVHVTELDADKTTINIYGSNTLNAICLKDRQETKNVAPDKIRRHVNEA